MAEIITFFRFPNNHNITFPQSLQNIYSTSIKNNCVPTFITSKARYIQPQPQVAHLQSDQTHRSNQILSDTSSKVTLDDTGKTPPHDQSEE